MESWLQTFRFGSALHVMSVASFLLAALCVVFVARRRRMQEHERRYALGIVGIVVIWQIISIAWWLSPARFSLASTLPLHVCDLAPWFGALALLTRWRFCRAVAYFWGIGLSTQGFITPVLTQGVGQFGYWLFWIGHTLIVLCPLYDILVRGYRPRARDYLYVTICNVAYIAFALPLNIALQTNYGYIGDSVPGTATLIDYLGAWPVRVFYMVLIAQIMMLALWLIWPIAARIPRRAAQPDSAA